MAERSILESMVAVLSSAFCVLSAPWPELHQTEESSVGWAQLGWAARPATSAARHHRHAGCRYCRYLDIVDTVDI